MSKYNNTTFVSKSWINNALFFPNTNNEWGTIELHLFGTHMPYLLLQKIAILLCILHLSMQLFCIYIINI